MTTNTISNTTHSTSTLTSRVFVILVFFLLGLQHLCSMQTKHFSRSPPSEQHISAAKPRCVWFSRGRWYTDPYNSEPAHAKHALRLRDKVGMLIQRPRNILYVRTLDEVREFTEKYGARVYDDATERRVDNMSHAHHFLCLFFGFDEGRNDNLDRAVNKLQNEVPTIDNFLVQSQALDHYTFLHEARIWWEHNKLEPVEPVAKRLRSASAHGQSRKQERAFPTAAVCYKRFQLLSGIPLTFRGDRHNINWRAVQCDYDGVAFDFCKVEELDGATHEALAQRF